MSERPPSGVVMIMTGPDEAAERSVSKDGDGASWAHERFQISMKGFPGSVCARFRLRLELRPCQYEREASGRRKVIV